MVVDKNLEKISTVSRKCLVLYWLSECVISTACLGRDKRPEAEKVTKKSSEQRHAINENIKTTCVLNCWVFFPLHVGGIDTSESVLCCVRICMCAWGGCWQQLQRLKESIISSFLSLHSFLLSTPVTLREAQSPLIGQFNGLAMVACMAVTSIFAWGYQKQPANQKTHTQIKTFHIDSCSLNHYIQVNYNI